VPGERVVFDSGHAIEFATVHGRALLSGYFDDMRGARLPTPVGDWLRGEPRSPLIVERGRRRLVVARVSGEVPTLLLTEEALAADGSKPLSYREWEVLRHVENGLSNAEIAAVLWISPATVRTHLENIYAKLGVRSRTAAVARARDLRRAESA
jgi:DNA-binding CsgD family transcriptional regulator